MFGTVRSGSRPVRAQSQQPARARQRLGRQRAIVLRSSCSGIVGLPQSRPWENDQSRVTIRPTAPAALARSMRGRRSRSRARPVDLEERLRVGGDDLLDRLAGERAQAHRRAARRRGAGDRDLAVGVDRLHAGGRDDHRQRDRLPHDGASRGRASLGRPATCGAKPSSPNAVDVVLERQPVLGAGAERHVHRLRQPLLRPPLRLGHRLEPARSPSGSSLSGHGQASGLSSHGRSGRVDARRGTGASGRPSGRGGWRRASPSAPSAASPWPSTHSGIRPVERQAGEELRRHAAAAARVEVRARRACAAGLRAAQLGEQLRLAPHRA